MAAATPDPHHGTRGPLAAGAPIPAAHRRSAGKVGPDRGYDHRRVGAGGQRRRVRAGAWHFLGPYLATGRLVRVLEADFEDGSAYFVVTPERPQRLRREVAQFNDWLLAAGRADGHPRSHGRRVRISIRELEPRSVRLFACITPSPSLISPIGHGHRDRATLTCVIPVRLSKRFHGGGRGEVDDSTGHVRTPVANRHTAVFPVSRL